jgi:Predicted ATP-dependent endonuclease of the OLD family
MYLQRIVIKNFRKFDEQGVEVVFNKGVNAIIGENNSGKSALIDALRIAFSTVPYKKEIFFNKGDFHVNLRGKVAQTAQFDLYFEEVPQTLFEIWNPEHITSGEFHIRFYTTKTANGLDKIKNTVWGGPVEGNPLSTDTFEALEIAFLGALRDAESELKPSRTSKLANLLGTIANTDDSRNDLIKVMLEANKEILKKAPVQKTKDIINNNLLEIEQDILRQRVDVGLVEPRFESIASSLRTWLKPRWFYLDNDSSIYAIIVEKCSEATLSKSIQFHENGIYLDVDEFLKIVNEIDQETKDELLTLANCSFELYQNGLGYNNLLFMSAVLGDMAIDKKGIYYNLFLIEEPEAHLHPQLQELVHNFFENRHDVSHSIQVIYTSHSPTLVSRIGVDKVNVFFEKEHRIQCLPLSKTAMDDTDKLYIERYLDVTKSQMFFAKGILFVEGICEALLLPEMAKFINRDLDKYAVEVVNINGVAFKPFANLLKKNGTSECFAKAAVVTDDDRCGNSKDKGTYISKDFDYDCEEILQLLVKLKQGKPSDRYSNIKTLCENTEIELQGAFKTLEYELALEGNNIPFILAAIEPVYPQVGKKLSKRVGELTSIDEKAICIWLFMQSRNSSKGEVAQALCKTLQEQNEEIRKGNQVSNKFCVPEYIKKAIYWTTADQELLYV